MRNTSCQSSTRDAELTLRYIIYGQMSIGMCGKDPKPHCLYHDERGSETARSFAMGNLLHQINVLRCFIKKDESAQDWQVSCVSK